MKLFCSESPSHWYQADGTPLHTVKSAKGEDRPTTLRDARKLNLLPSVTNILAVIAKPEVIAWMQDQAVWAALTLPRLPGELDDDFAKRVVLDSQSTRDSAADFGTEVHARAEHYSKTQIVLDDDFSDWTKLFADWFKANVVRVIWTEHRLISLEHGYAGTADLLIEHQAYGLTLVDIKTQGIKPGNKPAAYKSWCYQLAAYQKAIGKPLTALNLVINSKQPEPVTEHVWSEEELANGWLAFGAAAQLWRIEKKFDPRTLSQVIAG